MARAQKDSQSRELEDEEVDATDAPQVDESEVEDEGYVADEDDDEHDDLVEEIRLEDLAAMEGPDA